MIVLIKRFIAKSILRQSQFDDTETTPTEKRVHQFEQVLIKGRMVRVNKNKLPEDLPSNQDWFRIRIWSDELSGRSLTA
jgi:hypothetical protein